MKAKLVPAALCACLLAGCKTTSPPPAETVAPAAPSRLASLPAPAEIESNRYVIYAPDGSCKITIDTTKAVDMTYWAEHRLAPVLADWYPIMSSMMKTPGYTPPTNWTVTIAPGNGVAATGGTRVTANYPWFRTEMDQDGPFTGSGSPTFSASDITNLAGLSRRLLQTTNATSKYLGEQFSAALNASLQAFSTNKENSEKLQADLVQELNKVILGPRIPDSAVQNVRFRSETTALMRKNPAGDKLTELNRMLLEDAYPRDLVRKPLDEIADLSGIVKRLTERSDPVSAYLWKRLSQEDQATLKSYNPAASKPAEEVVLQTFDKLIGEPSIYAPALFKGVLLTEETKCILHQTPENARLSQVNRLLLQDAYAGELARTHLEGVGALVHEEVHVVQQYGSARRLNAPGNFAINDITNIVSLTKKLKEKADPVSAFLCGQLTTSELQALADYRGPGPTDYNTRTNLVVALNRIIRGPAIYDATLFKDVTLRPTTISLRDEKPEGNDLARLNRALIEDAFAGDLTHPVVSTNGGGGGRRGGGGGGNTGWLTEGIPDYIRWFIYQPEAHGADFTYFQKRADPKYDGLYRPSAYFLDYVTRKYDPHIVTKVNDACRQGKYYEAIWYDNTGKTLQELNTEWLDAFHKKKSAAS